MSIMLNLGSEGTHSFSENPIHLESNGWYFWDETWAHEYGPYSSYAECYTGMIGYCRMLSFDHLKLDILGLQKR